MLIDFTENTYQFHSKSSVLAGFGHEQMLCHLRMTRWQQSILPKLALESLHHLFVHCFLIQFWQYQSNLSFYYFHQNFEQIEFHYFAKWTIFLDMTCLKVNDYWFDVKFCTNVNGRKLENKSYFRRNTRFWHFILVKVEFQVFRFDIVNVTE